MESKLCLKYGENEKKYSFIVKTLYVIFIYLVTSSLLDHRELLSGFCQEYIYLDEIWQST